MGDDRSQSWLRWLLADTWARYFSDTPQVNSVDITYCRPSKTRLGWIALSESGRSTLIGINRLLRHAEVPIEVCLITVAHEVVHYCHGFGSPLPQRFPDPHAGRVVEQELIARGLGETLHSYERWAQQAWAEFYADRSAPKSRPLPAYALPPAAGPATASAVAALDVPAQRPACLPPTR